MNNTIGVVAVLVLFGCLLLVNVKKRTGILKDNKHTAIIVLGLGDDNIYTPILAWRWEQQGIKIAIFQTKWKSDEDYQSKLNRLENLIDKESQDNRVSLIGTSAGGSLVINAYAQRKNKINKIITICSRLKKGQTEGFRGFDERTQNYPAFRESVILAEENVATFSKEDRKNIMTVHAWLGDELVPVNTSTIDKAKNIIVPTGEHVISIASSLTIFSRPLIEFIASK